MRTFCFVSHDAVFENSDRATRIQLQWNGKNRSPPFEQSLAGNENEAAKASGGRALCFVSKRNLTLWSCLPE